MKIHLFGHMIRNNIKRDAFELNLRSCPKTCLSFTYTATSSLQYFCANYYKLTDLKGVWAIGV